MSGIGSKAERAEIRARVQFVVDTINVLRYRARRAVLRIMRRVLDWMERTA